MIVGEGFPHAPPTAQNCFAAPGLFQELAVSGELIYRSPVFLK